MTTPTVESTLLGPAPFVIGFTLKAGNGFDAEWLTPRVYGHSAEETAQRGAELLTAMKSVGLIDLTAKAAEYTRTQYKGGSAAAGSAPKRFENGKVTTKSTPAGEADDCEHGRKLVEKSDWAALFCQAREKSDQCEPLWRQKDGSYKAK
ncbi:hypothetical protein O3X23_06335 [Streptomyces sp. H39-S7]|nr:hypothetical protein [Streptomyces sp. H39-S7]MCZ4119013.1 hypothetical protein [Streptomyces sp. H39-S7]